MKYKGIIFDLDGVMCSTDDWDLQCFSDLLRCLDEGGFCLLEEL